MKKLVQILFVFLLFLITALPQDRNNRGLIPEKPTAERLLKMHQSNVDGSQGFTDRESILLKSQKNTWQMSLKNPLREFYEEEEFNAKDTRTTINKTLLGNGFLLIEEIYQNWDGSTWVNNEKYSYTYDGNNNLTESTAQAILGCFYLGEYFKEFIHI